MDCEVPRSDAMVATDISSEQALARPYADQEGLWLRTIVAHIDWKCMKMESWCHLVIWSKSKHP